MIEKTLFVRSSQSYDPCEFYQTAAGVVTLDNDSEEAEDNGEIRDSIEDRGKLLLPLWRSTHFTEDVSPCVKSLTQESVGFAEIEAELHQAAYPLRNVRCRMNGSTLVLTGNVCRYYYLQITIQIVMRFWKGRQILNEIQVLSPAPKCSTQSDQ